MRDGNGGQQRYVADIRRETAHAADGCRDFAGRPARRASRMAVETSKCARPSEIRDVVNAARPVLEARVGPGALPAGASTPEVVTP